MTPRPFVPASKWTRAHRRATALARARLWPDAARTRGFALLITITMLAFIVILLLGLAVYTRVETAIAGNTQRQAQARENALLGLNVAIAQLQKHAGPDTRVTATAASFGSLDGTRHYAGVWSSDPGASEPLTWLVSGNEVPPPAVSEPDAPEGSTPPASLAVTPSSPGSRLQTLVGRGATGDTTRSARWVDAPLVDITAPGVPGIAPTAPPATIGRYAWWVGDQGVKAPVAISDSLDDITYAPFGYADLRNRIRQQVTSGAGAADAASGEPFFEPRDATNTPLLANEKVKATNQLAFVRTSSNAPLGFSRVQQNFHAWSPNNYAVLADSTRGGLRQDLSLQPDLLGASFAAWANYPSYMESVRGQPAAPAGGEVSDPAPGPASATAPTIAPAYGDDPIRRRYFMSPHLMTGNTGGSHQVGPVLTYFLLSFNVRTEQTASGNPSSAPRPLEVRARWMFSLWNPYTSALVPENLQLEITGLPTVQVNNEEPSRAGTVTRFELQSRYGTGTGNEPPLLINLPWDGTNVPADTPPEDRQSWFPGRVYTWRSIEDTTKSIESPSAGYASAFYSRTLGDGGVGVIRPVPGPIVDGDDPCHLAIEGGGELEIRLFAVRTDGTRVQLGRYTSPPFVSSFRTDTQAINRGDYQFSYVFRLAESFDTPAEPGTWLTGPSRDPRLSRLRGDFFVVGENGDNPAQYNGLYSKIRSPNRLLDRAENAWSYNEDVPVFELPRGPLLSVGALQHFRIRGSRAFMIGNSWGARSTLNGVPLGALFDRFYFSGITADMTPAVTAAGDLLLPNQLLRPLRKREGTKVTAADVRATAAAPAPVETPADDGATTEPPEESPSETSEPATPPALDARSSKFFLQAGAFNVNSTSAAAWAAVLRGTRFPSPHSFTFLNASETTGTAEDAALATVQSGEAQFFRFPHSAQETYKAESGVSAADEEGVTPPNTHLFRRGMRTLTPAQVAALSSRIVELVALKHAALAPAGGPFRSLEEFLSPSDLFAGSEGDGNAASPRSLLEAAIADAGINASIAEFSSQWLTQGDIMTTLAPVLFARSDTFVIRTYGEAVNPATNAIEGRAWAEAIVQRVPEYFDPSLPAESLPSAFEPVPDPNNPDVTPTPTQAQELNRRYGRRFKIISFRWLTRSDI